MVKVDLDFNDRVTDATGRALVAVLPRCTVLSVSVVGRDAVSAEARSPASNPCLRVEDVYDLKELEPEEVEKLV
eukprot:COSAG06_NODE_19883_length_818_cov_67.901252_1_plen_74_part_00